MKKNLFNILLLFLLCVTGCDLLEVKSQDKLPGDEFWVNGNAANAESFLLSIYNDFRSAVMGESAFLTAGGDMRCAPILPYESSSSVGRQVTYLTANSMDDLRKSGGVSFAQTTKWLPFYKVIQSANILLKEIEEVPDITEDEREMFKAEAVFMRNLAYFFMVRHFGDVPYYTDAYNSASLPRTPMVTVLQNCLNDLYTGALGEDEAYSLLPWTYTSYAKKGVRASQGSVIALMMHINLWLVQFDDKNKSTYYQQVVDLGGRLERNNGAYELLDMNRIANVFRGGSNEGLFEIAQNINSSGEIFNQDAIFSNYVTYTYKGLTRKPIYYFEGDYMEKIYPSTETDLRKEYWFDQDMYSASAAILTEIKKFLNVDYYNNLNMTSNSGNQIVFRYADALLLYAEALAASGTDESKAAELLNRIRRRAGAQDVQASGDDLQDAIFWERQRELIGEGHYFYDLVRTGKISNSLYCTHPIRRTEFNVGAWTWPLHRDALTNNTNLQLNLYWE